MRNVPLILTILLVFAGITGCTQEKRTQKEIVQDYMPDNAVIAHRGTIFWAPELTEAAYRWARNTGADYVELDVQRSKDSVLIIIHDKTFKRTTDVDQKFPGREGENIGSFTFEEIMKLDAGSKFNILKPDQARESYAGLNVLVFEDVFRISEGKRIKRNPDGTRAYSVDENGKYIFEYENDPADNGHRPGVYIETKDPDSYPGIEEQVYSELTRMGWNPLEKRVADNSEPFYKNDSVNVGNTNGKILLQTFSRQGMENLKRLFSGEVPVSFLISNPKTDEFSKAEVRAEIINFASEAGAQFIGTNLGDANDGLTAEFASEIHAAGLKTNVYSFNTVEQMEKYFGVVNGGDADPLVDGMITNRAELTIDFYYNHSVRKYKTESNPEEILINLGYVK
jgi:glycerophosphoryl diester phosphodiesterase